MHIKLDSDTISLEIFKKFKATDHSQQGCEEFIAKRVQRSGPYPWKGIWQLIQNYPFLLLKAHPKYIPHIMKSCMHKVICNDIICKSKYWKNINAHPQEPRYKHYDRYLTIKKYTNVKIIGKVHMI